MRSERYLLLLKKKYGKKSRNNRNGNMVMSWY